MRHHVRHEAHDASLREYFSQGVVGRVQRRHARIRSNVTRLSPHVVVEVLKSDAQQRMVHKYPKALLEFGNAAVRIF